MGAFEHSCSLMPLKIRQALGPYEHAEEIRLRCGYPPTVILAGREHRICQTPVEEKDLLYVLEVATGASLHAVASSLQSGYICSRGLRIGICGRAVYKDGALLGFRKYRSLAVRIPHQCIGAIPEEICAELSSGAGNTLIAAAPGLGKTTALRELVRRLSESGVRISLIDERDELSGEGFELGPCTDVLTDVPKAQAAMILLRAANPQLIAMDEITRPEDTDAILHVAGCGVSVCATAHGQDLDDMRRRPVYRRLLAEGLFENLLTISIRNGKREYRLERINT